MLPNKMYAESTQKSRVSNWKNWIEPTQHKTAEEAVEYWLDHELKPSTIKQLLSQWKRYNPDAETSRLFRQLTRMEGARQINAWTSGEATKALSWAWALDKKLYGMLLFTLHTGVRKGELFNLTWDDVDLLGSHVNIRQTKTRRPRRIPLSKPLEEWLEKRYIVGATPVFRKCQPNDRLDQLCREAQVRRITWHGLRHTFATLALEAGRSPREVAEVLGHTKVSTTIDTYWQSTGVDMDLTFLP